MGNPIVELIILVATVVITLVVVGYFFGLFGAVSAQRIQVSGGVSQIFQEGNSYYLNVTITSNVPANITSVQVQGLSLSVNIPLKTGINKVTVPLPSGASFTHGNTYYVILATSDGITLDVPAYYP
ncbi:MAG: DUF973 family protein [Candidatus Aramenus sp.]|nr:DUF973 family protein [Candidatus Aramenus sp.]